MAFEDEQDPLERETSSKMNSSVTVSIVLYRTPESELRRVLSCVLHSAFTRKVVLVFNSGPIHTFNDPRIECIVNTENVGFGAAHNQVLLDRRHDTHYHLVLNPDISFDPGTLESLVDVLTVNQDIGLCMPRIHYQDGSLQYLCKLLPTPFDLFLRRFIPGALFSGRRALYELRFTGYDRVMDVPFLSGSFMLVRAQLARRLGGFDPRFFMYMEDVDFCRRMREHARVVFYPFCTAYHGYHKGSYHSPHLLYFHLRSAMLYFNKWGWLLDRRRKEINRAALSELMPPGTGYQTP